MTITRLGRETHKNLVNKAAKRFSKIGYTIIKEAKLSGKNRIDILALKGSKRVGIECQLTISHKIIKQKFIDYGSNLTKMIFVIPKSREEKMISVIKSISVEENIPKDFFEIWTENVDTTTTIRLRKNSKEILDNVANQIGKYSDTYDDIIRKLILHCKNCKNFKNGDNHGSS